MRFYLKMLRRILLNACHWRDIRWFSITNCFVEWCIKISLNTGTFFFVKMKVQSNGKIQLKIANSSLSSILVHWSNGFSKANIRTTTALNKPRTADNGFCFTQKAIKIIRIQKPSSTCTFYNQQARQNGCQLLPKSSGQSKISLSRNLHWWYLFGKEPPL